jgi:hypothetical protein
VVDKVVLGQVFLLSFLVFFCQYHSAMALQSHVIWGVNSRPVGGHNLDMLAYPIGMNNNKKLILK